MLAYGRIQAGLTRRTGVINIEALWAAPLEALAHSPSQMPLSCPVAPQAARS